MFMLFPLFHAAYSLIHHFPNVFCWMLIEGRLCLRCSKSRPVCLQDFSTLLIWPSIFRVSKVGCSSVFPKFHDHRRLFLPDRQLYWKRFRNFGYSGSIPQQETRENSNSLFIYFLDFCIAWNFTSFINLGKKKQSIVYTN